MYFKINYDSLNKNKISLKLTILGQYLVTILVLFSIKVLLTIFVYKYCDHKVQVILNKFD
jgi:hypothetical protein